MSCRISEQDVNRRAGFRRGAVSRRSGLAGRRTAEADGHQAGVELPPEVGGGEEAPGDLEVRGQWIGASAPRRGHALMLPYVSRAAVMTAARPADPGTDAATVRTTTNGRRGAPLLPTTARSRPAPQRRVATAAVRRQLLGKRRPPATVSQAMRWATPPPRCEHASRSRHPARSASR